MRRRLLFALALAATAATIAVPLAPAAKQGRSFVVYAKPTRAQFVNHADDRARGKIKNPFDSNLLPTPASANAGKKGARAGDNALLSFELYSDLNLKRLIGSAIYSCTFNFAHQAICEANFELNGGTMIAMGPANMDSSSVVLAVTGGTGQYAGAHGQLASKSSATRKSTQVIRFRLA